MGSALLILLPQAASSIFPQGLVVGTAQLQGLCVRGGHVDAAALGTYGLCPCPVRGWVQVDVLRTAQQRCECCACRQLLANGVTVHLSRDEAGLAVSHSGMSRTQQDTASWASLATRSTAACTALQHSNAAHTAVQHTQPRLPRLHSQLGGEDLGWSCSPRAPPAPPHQHRDRDMGTHPTAQGVPLF